MENWKRRFFIIWAGQAFSLVGSMLVQFALVWWLTETTGSATILATGTLVGMLPGIVIGPFVGGAGGPLESAHGDDRRRRRHCPGYGGSGSDLLGRSHADLARIRPHVRAGGGGRLSLARHAGQHLAHGAARSTQSCGGHEPDAAGCDADRQPATGGLARGADAAPGHSGHRCGHGRDRHCSPPDFRHSAARARAGRRKYGADAGPAPVSRRGRGIRLHLAVALAQDRRGDGPSSPIWCSPRHSASPPWS